MLGKEAYSVQYPNIIRAFQVKTFVQKQIHSGMDKKTITLFQLESVILKDLPNLKSFIHNANYEYHMPNLRSMDVDNCGVSTLFTFSAFSCLQQLEELRISYCPVLEEIVENDLRGDEPPSGTDNKTITLSQLKSVFLKDLPNLKSFIHNANYECHMPALEKVKNESCGVSSLFTFSAFSCLQQLEELRISYCPVLEEIVENDVRGDETSGMDNKTIILFRLESVYLKGLPKLKSFNQSANYECHMPALESMKVNNCGVSTLFTCSVFRNLQQLESLEVSNCRLLEGIVEDVRGDQTSDKIITLFRLWKIILTDLPKLKSFSSTTSYAFNMPKLSSIHLSGCPQVESFTYFKTSTALKEFPDLNDYISQNQGINLSVYENRSSNSSLSSQSTDRE